MEFRKRVAITLCTRQQNRLHFKYQFFKEVFPTVITSSMLYLTVTFFTGEDFTVTFFTLVSMLRVGSGSVRICSPLKHQLSCPTRLQSDRYLLRNLQGLTHLIITIIL